MDQLKIGTGWIDLKITSEPFVVMTFKGYIPAVHVKVLQNKLEKYLYIGAKSLAQGLEPLRKENENKFSELVIRIKKEDDSVMSPYRVEAVKL